MVTSEFTSKKWLGVVSWWKGEERGLEDVSALHILLGEARNYQ